jgi:hypothetical protein
MKANVAALTIAVAVCCLPAVALDIKLADLVAQSEVIMYGHIIPGGGATESRVSFDPLLVLKGQGIPANKSVPVCNAAGGAESFDLRAARSPLIIFAKSSADCLMPVHGSASTIAVNRGFAETTAIYDQPSKQRSAEFLAKIRRLVPQAH